MLFFHFLKVVQAALHESDNQLDSIKTTTTTTTNKQTKKQTNKQTKKQQHVNVM
jgi:hypothetical protein